MSVREKEIKSGFRQVGCCQNQEEVAGKMGTDSSL